MGNWKQFDSCGKTHRARGGSQIHRLKATNKPNKQINEESGIGLFMYLAAVPSLSKLFCLEESRSPGWQAEAEGGGHHCPATTVTANQPPFLLWPEVALAGMLVSINPNPPTLTMIRCIFVPKRSMQPPLTASTIFVPNSSTGWQIIAPSIAQFSVFCWALRPIGYYSYVLGTEPVGNSYELFVCTRYGHSMNPILTTLHYTTLSRFSTKFSTFAAAADHMISDVPIIRPRNVEQKRGCVPTGKTQLDPPQL